MIVLGPLALMAAAGLVLAAAALSLGLAMGMQRQLLWAGLRMAVQLLCVGYLLREVIARDTPLLTALVGLLMLGAAAHEVGARQSGQRAFGASLMILAVSTVGVAAAGLAALGGLDARHAIPVFGIILGSAMNAAALTLHSLDSQLAQQRAVIEARLAHGEDLATATGDLTRSAVRSGTIPVLNQMAGAGVITLPGIMSGQILAGQDPSQAALYQIFLMALLALASVVCVALVRWRFLRRIGDDRQRLRP